MESLEHLVHKMESQMDQADSKLDFLSTRLDLYETNMIMPIVEKENSAKQLVNFANKTEETHHKEQDMSGKDENYDDDLDPKLLRDLLMDVKNVRQEYDQLLQDVHQVQELQQAVTLSLRKEMKQVQRHFDSLRERVVGSSGGTLPTNK